MVRGIKRSQPVETTNSATVTRKETGGLRGQFPGFRGVCVHFTCWVGVRVLFKSEERSFWKAWGHPKEEKLITRERRPLGGHEPRVGQRYCQLKERRRADKNIDKRTNLQGGEELSEEDGSSQWRGWESGGRVGLGAWESQRSITHPLGCGCGAAVGAKYKGRKWLLSGKDFFLSGFLWALTCRLETAPCPTSKPPEGLALVAW